MQQNSNTNQHESVQKSSNEHESTKEETSFVEQINTYSPYPYFNAVGAIIVFLLLGKIIDWIITGILSKLVGKTDSDFDNELLNLLHRPIFLSVVLFGLTFATYLLEQPERITSITVHILQTIAVLVWFRFGLKVIKLSLDKLELAENKFLFVTATTKPLLINSFYIVLTAITVYIIFLIWKIDITAVIASAGIIGLAVGFAAKDTLANVFGGATIFADKPFKVGDFVILKDGERGVITQIGIRSTRILTRDDIEITVPNGVLATTTIINESGGPHEKFRIRVKVGVAYGSDIDKVENALLSVAQNHKEVCEEPEPRVRFRVFAASSLDYELLCWVERPVLRGRVLHELNREVYKTFDREKIKIPFPQQEIYIKQFPQRDSD